jgi:predicted Co/Zn/Cd cation transporter (cation efflux family)
VHPDNLRRNAVRLCWLSLIALIALVLALTDIWHGEADVTLEWNVVRVALVIMLAFHVWCFRLFRTLEGPAITK